LDKLDEVLQEEQVTIGRLDQRTRELLREAKEAHVSACAELQEDLNDRTGVVSQRELKVVKQERELQGKEEEITSKLEREQSELTSRADDISAHEAALETEQEHLRKMHENLYNCELVISSQEGTL
jgi:chromosome segregation ATPase